MPYTDDLHHLRVEMNRKGCDVPADERARMERSLNPLREAVRDFSGPELIFNIIRHPRSDTYHVEAVLRLPGRTVRTGDEDLYLDSAFQRCLRKLVRRAEDSRDHRDERAEELAQQRASLDRDIVAPEDPTNGHLAHFVEAGDYRGFRTALSPYEEWLRKRVGRWVQRYPQAQDQVGRGLIIGDLVEEVYLNAFEGYPQRRTEVRFHQWLEDLIDPSLKALLRHPYEESENASLARTVRELRLT